MTRQGSSDRTEAQGCAKRNYRDMSQAAFAALFLTNATAARVEIRRHKKARTAGYSFHLSEKRSSSKGIGSVFVFSKN